MYFNIVALSQAGSGALVNDRSASMDARPGQHSSFTVVLLLSTAKLSLIASKGHELAPTRDFYWFKPLCGKNTGDVRKPRHASDNLLADFGRDDTPISVDQFL